MNRLNRLRITAAALLAVIVSVCTLVAAPRSGNPVADPKAVVTAGDARFTVLTSRLIRMEWAADSSFEERPSLVFLNRRLPVPEFTSTMEGGWLLVQTADLAVRYKRGTGRFSENNLEIRFSVAGTPNSWHPGMKDSANLGGTIRTLDGVQGPTDLQPGLLSRAGWVVVDDTERPLFDNSDWPWVLPRSPGDRQDMYFFGYGHDYKRQLYDFTTVAGKIPLPPRFAFGAWWSRYWAYTDEEFEQLVREFRMHDVPLDVLVIDMDWHLTFNQRWGKAEKDQAGNTLGWTGYTWDKNFFPDPKGFLDWCDNHGLKTPLNLHPASGIQPHEDNYPEMARSMGIDPASKKYVPFDIVDKNYAENYLKYIIRPLEKQGVDFWWLDWQQWWTTKIPGVTPTWWLNYVFFTDMERRNAARPLLFHRWGGLGNHRYQIGFSGDVISVWESLAFQPYFTSTASNVGFGYWSHDIGGHMPGQVSPELYTRWIQFGIFSPILRTHTTKNPASERRIWAYPIDYFLVMRDAFLLRYAMIPYIYTESREAYDSGVSLCRPMYYDYPEKGEAYSFKDQYMYGRNMLIAPVADSVSPATMLSRKSIWLPQGEWYEWFTGARLRGPAVVDRSFAVDEIPVYVRAGAVIPMQPKMDYVGQKPVDPLILTIIPGDSGSTRVYEDEGNSLGYQRGECAWTPVRHSGIRDGRQAIDILPVAGTYAGMLKERAFEIRLPGTWPPASVTCNGKEISRTRDGKGSGWRYDGDQLMIVITVPKHAVNKKVEVVVRWPQGADPNDPALNGVPGVLARMRRVMAQINTSWPEEWSPEVLIHASQTGNRMGVDPGQASLEVKQLRAGIPEIETQIQALSIPDALKQKALVHLNKGNL